MSVEHYVMIPTGKTPRYSDRNRTCPDGIFSTTNFTRNSLGVNADLEGERPATNRLSQGTTHDLQLILHAVIYRLDVVGINVGLYNIQSRKFH
jgi:hypothetical protein